MKKFLTILATLAICIALNFGLTNEAQASELNSSIEAGNFELQEVYDHYRDHHHRHRPPPPPPPPHHRHRTPPPPPDYWDRDYPPPPPPPPHHRKPPRW